MEDWDWHGTIISNQNFRSIPVFQPKHGIEKYHRVMRKYFQQKISFSIFLSTYIETSFNSPFKFYILISLVLRVVK